LRKKEFEIVEAPVAGIAGRHLRRGMNASVTKGGVVDRFDVNPPDGIGGEETNIVNIIRLG